MEEISFYITSKDLDRLFELKDQEGQTDLTANDFAKVLLLRELHRHPKTKQE